jgi:hypothetical protein
MNDRNGGNGKRLRSLGQSMVLRAALEQGESAQDHEDNRGANKKSEEPVALRGLLPSPSGFHL